MNLPANHVRCPACHWPLSIWNFDARLLTNRERLPCCGCKLEVPEARVLLEDLLRARQKARGQA